MQPETVILFGPITIASVLLLFPRQATLVMWRPFKWLVEWYFSHLDPGDVAYARRRLREQNPRTRTDWFWQERVGAAVVLVVLVGAYFWL